MASWLDASVETRTDWNDHLFSLAFKCPDFPAFQAGQFTKIGLPNGDKILSRAYSLVSHPKDNYLEVLAVPVEDGALSPQLQQLQVGDKVKIASPATGFLTLKEVPDSETLWLMATGTGVGPFISMLRGQSIWQRYNKVVLVYAARLNADLAYRDFFDILQKEHPQQFYFVPVISREAPPPDGLQGRIPELIKSQQIQGKVALSLNHHNSQVMLCGNPEMIKEMLLVLESMGLKKHLRRAPGQISLERYW